MGEGSEREAEDDTGFRMEEEEKNKRLKEGWP